MKFLTLLTVLLGLIVSTTEAFWLKRIQQKAAAVKAAHDARVAATLNTIKDLAGKVDDAIPIDIVIDQEKIASYFEAIVLKAGDCKSGWSLKKSQLTVTVTTKIAKFKAFIDKLLILLPTVKAAVRAKLDALCLKLKTRLSTIYALKLKLKAQIAEDLAAWKVKAKAQIAAWKLSCDTKQSELDGGSLTTEQANDCKLDISALKVKIAAKKAEIIEKVGTTWTILKPKITAALIRLGIFVDQSSETVCDCVQEEMVEIDEVVCDAANLAVKQAVGIGLQNGATKIACNIRDAVAAGVKESQSILIFDHPEQWAGFQEPDTPALKAPEADTSGKYVVHISKWALIMAVLLMASCAVLGTVLYCHAKRQNARIVDTAYAGKV